MKNLIKFFMVMAVLCMTGCSQTFEDISNNAKPQEKTQGRLVMNVGNRSRTIMPTVDTLKNNIKSATLTANDTEIGRWSWSGDNGDNVINQIESDNNILLDVGTYSFEMKFCNENSDVILIGTINNKKIETGDNKLIFDMQISTTGKGNISITLSREADSGINKIKAGLYDIATGEAVAGYEAEEQLDVSDTQWTYSKDNVSAGQYIIKFEVYDTSDKLLNTLTDVIEVIGGITTTAQKILNKINTQYTITYNRDGGNWKNGFTPVEVRNANTKVTLPTADNIEKENFILAGWYDGKGNIITEIPSDTTGDITVTARWGITSEAAISKIENLSGSETYDIVIGGTITSGTISDIKTALTTLQTKNSSAKVNLDLSGTTGLTTIGDYAFQHCGSLESVTIPAGVTTIGTSAFFGCTGLTSVTIPAGVKEIGNHAFNACSLTSVTIPDSVTTIGVSAFYGCSSLISVTIGKGVKTIIGWAFGACSNLTTVNYKGTEDEWKEITIQGDGNSKLTGATINYNAITVTSDNVSTEISKLTEGGSYTIIVTGAITNDTISAIKDALLSNSNAKVNLDLSGTIGLTSIGVSAFEDSDNLTSLTIPYSVTTIGTDAFYGCSSLKSVTIPESVTSIGDYAFSHCDNLTSVTIPDSVTSISANTFEYCDNLTSVTIPVSVIEIGYHAFYCCSSLTTVNYKGTQEEWNKITGINQFVNATINYGYTGE